jgi:hypothetical protein
MIASTAQGLGPAERLVLSAAVAPALAGWVHMFMVSSIA